MKQFFTKQDIKFTYFECILAIAGLAVIRQLEFSVNNFVLVGAYAVYIFAGFWASGKVKERLSK